MYIGSLLFLNKKAPSPRLRINPYLTFDVTTGNIILPPDKRKVTNKIDDLLKGKTENTQVTILEDSEHDQVEE